MVERIERKRFPDRDPDEPKRQGIYMPEAKEYGVGAFSFNVRGYGVPYLLFRYPNKCDPNDEQVAAGSVPIGGIKGWVFDGNRDVPTVSPSILYTTWIDGEWVEKFHGRINGGYLEVL